MILPPCDRFTLDYVLEGRTDPNRRYCTCGWTEAHHDTHHPTNERLNP